jgi:AhpD family alkylhydroperoxidase
MKIQVFDPALCCATGVCGPDADAELVRFAEDVEWLESHSIEVERYNLAERRAIFAETPVVKDTLDKEGDPCLPLTVVDGAVVCKGRYPTRDMLAGWAGLELKPSLFTDAVRELVAIGAAIGSNCEPCFKHHYNEARKLGVSKEDMRLAVKMAKMVKDTPARSILELADKYLAEPQPQASPCCSGPSRAAPGGKCCG